MPGLYGASVGSGFGAVAFEASKEQFDRHRFLCIVSFNRSAWISTRLTPPKNDNDPDIDSSSPTPMSMISDRGSMFSRQ
jgi:hypothetical protein